MVLDPYAEHWVESEHRPRVFIVISERDLGSAVNTQVFPGGHVSQAHLLFPSQDIAFIKWKIRSLNTANGIVWNFTTFFLKRGKDFDFDEFY